MSRLTELVKARVDPQLKRDVEAHCERTGRSEGAVVRLALREYLNKGKRGK